jgi:hypothetical protein
LAEESALIACVKALSLALRGELKAPLTIDAPLKGGATQSLRLTEKPTSLSILLHPWPFRRPALTVEAEGLILPERGRLADEPSIRRCLDPSARFAFSARLSQN